MNKNLPVLVTGGSGYIASWIIQYLLDDGFTVHTTVRDKTDTDKTGHLLKMAAGYPGRLSFFEADLLRDKSFDDSMKDCEIVIHTASPFRIQGIKNPVRELIDPALKGTINVLESVNRNLLVKRVVLTSSVVSIYNDAAEILTKINGKFTEDDWNTTSSANYQPYNYSKTVAEKEAWKRAHEQNRWDLAVINPAFVLGPSLSKRTDSTSADFIKSLVDGRMKFGVPNLYFGVVDVRDVARAHIQAAILENVHGRFILAAESFSVMDMVAIIKSQYGTRFACAKSTIPALLIYALGPVSGFSWKYLKSNLGIRPVFDNSKSIVQLGIRYKPVNETLIGQIDKMIEYGLLK